MRPPDSTPDPSSTPRTYTSTRATRANTDEHVARLPDKDHPGLEKWPDASIIDTGQPHPRVAHPVQMMIPGRGGEASEYFTLDLSKLTAHDHAAAYRTASIAHGTKTDSAAIGARAIDAIRFLKGREMLISANDQGPSPRQVLESGEVAINFCLVVVPETGDAVTTEHKTLASLGAAYRAARMTCEQVFVFAGARLATSAGGCHVLTPQGWVALDVPPPPAPEIDPGGFARIREEPAPAPEAIEPDPDDDDDDAEDDLPTL